MGVHEYEIGGVRVLMTQEQADRWNNGESTSWDMDSIVVLVPDSGLVRSVGFAFTPSTAEHVSLREVFTLQAHADLAGLMDGLQANFVAE